MRQLMIPVAAALALVALDAAPAKAQYVTGGYYSQGYPGAYSPYSYGGPQIVIGGGGISFGAYPAYSGYSSYSGYSNYSSYSGYGYRPSYGGGYNSYPGGRYSPAYGGGRPVYYGGGYSGYSGGWRR